MLQDAVEHGDERCGSCRDGDDDDDDDDDDDEEEEEEEEKAEDLPEVLQDVFAVEHGDERCGSCRDDDDGSSGTCEGEKVFRLTGQQAAYFCLVVSLLNV